MPRCDFNCDHEELVKDKRRVRDCDHFEEGVGQRVCDEELRKALDETALKDGYSKPDEECSVGQELTGGEFFVQFRIESAQRFVNVTIENECEHWYEGI